MTSCLSYIQNRESSLLIPIEMLPIMILTFLAVSVLVMVACDRKYKDLNVYNFFHVSFIIVIIIIVVIVVVVCYY